MLKIHYIIQRIMLQVNRKNRKILFIVKDKITEKKNIYEY